jgi:predicted RNase H-like HicB family nuclease
VLVATSPDLPGLVAEAKTPQELIQSVYDCADMLIGELANAKVAPYVAWDGQAVLR